MSFESFEELRWGPFHSRSEQEGVHDGTNAPDPIPPSDLASGSAEAVEQRFAPVRPDLSKFDLTVGEAREAFQLENRKIPSTRTLRRYCQEGRIDCFKLKTNRNGIPIHDWIIDSTSLWEFIQSCPQDDTRFTNTTPAPPGDAKIDTEAHSGGEKPARTATAPDRPSNAVKDPTSSRTPGREPEITAAQADADRASCRQHSCVGLLIENARLTAHLDAQSELVSELREDKRFMREEIAQHRTTTGS